jgi:hypothetical protein
MMQRGIGVGEQWTYRALLLNGCKGLSLAHFARFQVVLNGGIDRHGSYSRPLWLGNAPFRGVFSSAKNTHHVVEEKLLIMLLLPLGCVNVVVRNEVNPFIGGGARITHSLGVYNTFRVRVRSGLDLMFKEIGDFKHIYEKHLIIGNIELA